MSTFTPKPFAEIVARMVEQMRSSTDRVTDFNVGSVVRSLLEACAVELDDYYQAVYLGLLQSIPVAVYTGFGFALRPAVAAAGIVRLTRVMLDPGPELVPAGTRLRAGNGVTYTTNMDAYFAADSTTLDVPATADVVGVIGNADPGALSLPSSRISGTNPAAFSGGQDAETEDQRAERFAAYILSLSRGTVASLEFAATEPALMHPVTNVLAERVQRASAHETAGHVDLYIFNGSFGASDDLIEAVQVWIDGARDDISGAWVGGYRPAGMRVDVHALVETSIDVEIEVTRRANAAVEAPLQGAVDRVLRAANPGSIVRPLDIVQAVLAVDGVLGVSIVAPTEAVTVPHDAIMRLGHLTITWRA